jgi:hypothetical protein
MSAEVVIDSLTNRILELEHQSIDNDYATRQFVSNMKNRNTQVLTESHIRLFRNWLAAKSESRAPEHIDPKQLDIYLAQFTLTIRKDGDADINHSSRQYEPCTLSAMHSSFFRYLNSKDYKYNIKTSHMFRHSRDVLSSKMKELKKLGKGNKPQAAESFTSEEVAKMYEMQVLGVGNNILFHFLYCDFRLIVCTVYID